MKPAWPILLCILSGCQAIIGIEDLPPVAIYRVHGIAGGLTEPVALRLELTGAEELLSVTEDGAFSFNLAVPDRSSYVVSIAGESPCIIDNAVGTLTGANGEIALACNGAASLSDILLSGLRAPDLQIAPDVLRYDISISVLQQGISVTPLTADETNQIHIDGMPAMSGSATAELTIGEKRSFLISVEHPSGLRRNYTLTVRRELPPIQIHYLKSSNSDSGDGFGYVVAASGDTIAVGAPFEDSAAKGVNGSQTSNQSEDSGAVYIFRRIGSGWEQEAYIKASNADPGDQFGIDLSLDGDTLAVGAYNEASDANGVGGDESDNTSPQAGAVYIFRRTGTSWQQEAYIKASNSGAYDQFCHPRLSGEQLVVSAFLEDSSSTGIGGSQTNDATPDSGAVYVFRREGSIWRQTAYMKASNTSADDWFGENGWFNGSMLAVDARWEDGGRASSGAEDDESASNSGAVYIFEQSAAGDWMHTSYIKSPHVEADDHFGDALWLWQDYLLVGARYEDSAFIAMDGSESEDLITDSGTAYIFRSIGEEWVPSAYLKASNAGANDWFGDSLQVNADMIVVAAPFEDSASSGINQDQNDNSAIDSGAVYLFQAAANTQWNQVGYIKESNAGAGDWFGEAMALTEDMLLIGARSEDSNARGLDGTQDNNLAPDSGAVYMFY